MAELKLSEEGRLYTQTNINGEIITIHFHPRITNWLKEHQIKIGARLPYAWKKETRRWQYTDSELSQYNGKESFCRKAQCPVCGDDVFYYENNFGSKVYFDCLGFPWLKHPCTNNSFLTEKHTQALKKTKKHTKIYKSAALQNQYKVVQRPARYKIIKQHIVNNLLYILISIRNNAYIFITNHLESIPTEVDSFSPEKALLCINDKKIYGKTITPPIFFQHKLRGGEFYIILRKIVINKITYAIFQRASHILCVAFECHSNLDIGKHFLILFRRQRAFIASSIFSKDSIIIFKTNSKHHIDALKNTLKYNKPIPEDLDKKSKIYDFLNIYIKSL